jgi:uncharacterized protein (DUF433 family)
MATNVNWPETADIHDRGMGPEIRGTRIVMTDIYPWLGEWSVERIAEFYRLTVPQVLAAVAYIEANREMVEEDMRVLQERAERGNPPHIRAMLEESHKKLLAWKKQLDDDAAAQRAQRGGGDARAAG